MKVEDTMQGDPNRGGGESTAVWMKASTDSKLDAGYHRGFSGGVIQPTSSFLHFLFSLI